MTPKSLIIILLRIVGIYIVFNAISVIPQFIATLYSLNISYDETGAVIMFYLPMTLLTIAIYFLVIRFCIFKPNWIIGKLNLDKGFAEEKFDLDFNKSSILMIVILILGGLIFADGLPYFCLELYRYLQQSQPGMFVANLSADWMIIYFLKTLIGYLLMTNSKSIVKYIEKNTSEESSM